MRNNENTSMCSLCKGKCCNSSAGGWFPEDIKGGITKETLIKMYNQGYQFDWWEGNPTDNEENKGKTAYYLRPQHTNSLGKIRDGSWGGRCSFLGTKGCTKVWDERPTQCRALKPVDTTGKNCDWEKKYGKKEIAVAWLPYNDIIEETIRELNERRNTG